jgi:hypothetical protein
MAVLTALRQLLAACAKPWHPQARSPADMRGQWSGGTDWLRRSDQADLERRDLPWLRRSRPLMLDMQVSGLRDIAAGMSVVGGA